MEEYKKRAPDVWGHRLERLVVTGARKAAWRIGRQRDEQRQAEGKGGVTPTDATVELKPRSTFQVQNYS